MTYNYIGFRVLRAIADIRHMSSVLTLELVGSKKFLTRIRLFKRFAVAYRDTQSSGGRGVVGYDLNF